MRSKSLGINLDRSTPVSTDSFQQFGQGPRSLSVTPGGQVTFRAVNVESESPTGESHEETFHLDTDEGFTRFVDLITESAQRAKAREIKSTLYLR